MTHQEPLLEQNTVLGQLQDWIATGTFQTALLHGPSGSGKTWIAKAIATTLPDITVLFATGDRQNPSRALLPFSTSVSLTNTLKHFTKVTLPDATKSIPLAGAAASAILQYIGNRREIQLARQMPYLQQAERDILVDIGTIVKRSRVLLIADNLHWWDERSLDLLALLMSSHLSEHFPYLSRTQILAIVTDDQEPAFRNAFEVAHRHLKTGPIFKSQYCDKKGFGAVLAKLGLHAMLSAEMSDTMHQISGGHLAVARQLVDYLNSTTVSDDLLRYPDFERLCEAIVNRRISDLDERGDQVRSLLAYAATIGASFTYKELACITNLLTIDFEKCVRDATGLSLLSKDDNNRLSFSHDIIAQILGSGRSDSKQAHVRFASCLNALRPGDYPSRARHHEFGGEVASAKIMEGLSILREAREGRIKWIQHALNSLAEGGSGSLVKAIRTLVRAYELFRESRFQDALRAASTVAEHLPDAILAERDYVQARCHIQLLTSQDRRDAVAVLAQWDTLRGEELEIWSRLALTRIVALSYVGDVESARQQAKSLVTRLRSRVDDDPDSARVIYQLMLRADMLYEPEAANEQIRDAVRYFGPAAGVSARDPLNYYIALCNLSANEVMLGDHRRAYEAAIQCVQYLETAVTIGDLIEFPRPDMLANNFLLCAYRHKKLSLGDVTLKMERLLHSTPQSIDLALIASNLGAFFILEGRYDEAVSLLYPWFESLTSGEEFDEYYPYFVGNNLVASLIGAGNTVLAELYWKQIGALLPSLCPIWLRRYLLSRHKLLSQGFSKAGLSLSNWESALKDPTSSSVGPAWNGIAQAVLLSDMQFWAEG